MMAGTERLDSLPGGRLSIWQDAREFCFTTDAVFLAAFPHVIKKCRALELGCGTGAVSLMLAERGAGSVLGIDVNAHVVELLRRSIALNKLADRVRAEVLDIRQLKDMVQSESMDLVAANPPYRIGGRQRHLATAACPEVGRLFPGCQLCPEDEGTVCPGTVAGAVYGRCEAGNKIPIGTEAAAMGPFLCGTAGLDLFGRICEGRPPRP